MISDICIVISKYYYTSNKIHQGLEQNRNLKILRISTDMGT